MTIRIIPGPGGTVDVPEIEEAINRAVTEVEGSIDVRINTRVAEQKRVVIGDTQPLTTAHMTNVRKVFDDIAKRRLKDAILIHVGDVADAGDSTRQPYTGGGPFTMAMMRAELLRTGIPPSCWTVLRGNHDVDYNLDGSNPQNAFSYREFEKVFEGPPFFYTATATELCIFMGPQARNTAGNVTDDVVVTWCKQLVADNQHRLIRVYTHQPLQNTVAGSTTVGGSQLESYRFLDWIGTPGHRVDIWYSGHSGTDLNNPAVASHVVVQGCLFIGVDMNVGIDADDGVDPTGVGMSYVIETVTPTLITFERVNANAGGISKKWTLVPPVTLELTSGLQFDGRRQYDARHGIMTRPQLIATNLNRVWDGSAWVPTTAPQDVLTLAVEDLRNDDCQAGQGARLALRVPGANSGSSSANQPNQNRASRFGAGVAAVRLTATETDFTSALRLYASTAGVDAYPAFSTSNEVAVMDYAATYAQLLVSGYSFRMQHANAGELGFGIVQSTGGTSALFFPRGTGGGTGYSAAATIMQVGKTSANRSINAGGTINASGADYAEYFEVAPHLYGSVPKGAILGVRSDGLLTDRYDDVVGPFLVKTTAPNLVGGDDWGSEDVLCAKYGLEPLGDPPVMTEPAIEPLRLPDKMSVDEAEVLEREHQARTAQARIAALATFEAERRAYDRRSARLADALEQERIKVDRMALRGVVPVNLPATSADVGGYIVPERDSDGGIAPRLMRALTKAQRDVVLGRVVRVARDGRALVLV